MYLIREEHISIIYKYINKYIFMRVCYLDQDFLKTYLCKQYTVVLSKFSINHWLNFRLLGDSNPPPPEVWGQPGGWRGLRQVLCNCIICFPFIIVTFYLYSTSLCQQSPKSLIAPSTEKQREKFSRQFELFHWSKERFFEALQHYCVSCYLVICDPKTSGVYLFLELN